MTGDAQNIRALLSARQRAVSAGDAAAAVAATADGAVTYDLQPPLAYVHDRAGAIAGLNAWFATWDGPITNELREPSVIVSGDLAVAWGCSQLRGVSKSDGFHESWYRTTVVLERRVLDWRIIHEHLSYPMRMDGTGLSAVDLTPE